MPSPGYKHGDTPKKAMVRGTISYLESQGLPVNKAAIFRHFGMSRSQGYAAMTLPPSKRDDPEWEETRGRPSKVTEADQQKMERVLWDDEYEGVSLNWAGLAKAAGVAMECNTRTLHRTMGTLGYRRCLSCGRCVVHKRCREKRVDYARKMLDAYPDPRDWRRVRFSVELHFGFGLDGKVRLLPRPGERFCPQCADEPEANWPRDVRRLHAWAAAGHGFKSGLVFYEESTNPNCTGSMSQADYHDKILEKAVKPWLVSQPDADTVNGVAPDAHMATEALAAAAGGTSTPVGGEPLGGMPASGAPASGAPASVVPSAFILEEDGEAYAHGGLSKVNPVQQWKDAMGLRHFFSCGDCPDLSPLDSLWPPRKQWQVKPLKDWEDETLQQAAADAWADVGQERIDIWVDVMPQRLRHVIETDGRLVPW
ncbi:hypothetical protein HIM_00808 [Hirsutella minnesotensis 3608]|nr:hypothetical protein HIM_00808 [Hirsutella minnesotensis 3608]